MAKVRESSESGLVAMNYLSLSKPSYVEIGRQIGCSKSATFIVF